jgi:hypothetical protein
MLSGMNNAGWPGSLKTIQDLKIGIVIERAVVSHAFAPCSAICDGAAISTNLPEIHSTK